MTFFKALHRALPTNTRFQGDHKCRLGCGKREHFVHFMECRKLKRPFWGTLVNIMNSFDCGRYFNNKLLIGFTLKRADGELKVINRHMKGLVWLAWKFLWQQLAAIGEEGEGSFNPDEAFNAMFRMHHTAVLAALQDYKSVRIAMEAGGRMRYKREQMDGCGT